MKDTNSEASYNEPDEDDDDEGMAKREKAIGKPEKEEEKGTTRLLIYLYFKGKGKKIHFHELDFYTCWSSPATSPSSDAHRSTILKPPPATYFS
jgi:hypothetical protein